MGDYKDLDSNSDYDSDAFLEDYEKLDCHYDPDFEPDPEPEDHSNNQNRMKLPTLARAAKKNYIADSLYSNQKLLQISQLQLYFIL